MHDNCFRDEYNDGIYRMSDDVTVQNTEFDLRISEDIRHKWWQIVNLMASITGVTSAVMMRLLDEGETVEVFATNPSDDNPLRRLDKLALSPHSYCHHVITTREMLHVPDSNDDPRWDEPPLGMRSYVGVPLLWPDGSVFGSMCLMNVQPQAFSDEIIAMLTQFRATVELDMKSMLLEQHTRRMQRELAEAQKLARLGNWHWDVRNDVLHIGDNVYELYGVKPPAPSEPSNLLARTAYLRTVVHRGDWIDLETVEDYMRFFKDGASRTYRVWHPELGERWLRSMSMHIHDENGTLLRIRGTVQDVTDQVRSEEKSREAALEQERTRMLATFVRDLSHEIKTPLSVMGTSLYVLRESDDADKRHKHVRRLQEQIRQISDMVDTLTHMARLDALQVSECLPVDLSLMVREAASTAQMRVGNRACDFKLEIPDALKITQAYGGELSQALVNLLDNAFRYTGTDGLVRVRLSVEDEAAVLSIQDTGEGMTADVLSRCFDRFYRADTARTKRGLGMGLPIARKTVRIHGGDIYAESRPGEGSVFTVVLPMGNRV